MKYYTKPLIYAFLLLGINACSSSEQSKMSEQMQNVHVDLDSLIDGKVSSNILKSVPTPVEINTYIVASEEAYHKDFLNNVDLSSEYVSTFKKSLNLGVYSADMAYINLHKKLKDVFSYFRAVRGLTSDLNISTLFDLQKMKYYADNMDKNDSLVYVLAKDFDFMLEYLNTHQKSDVAVLMITGGFIESLNIARQVYLVTKNDELKEKILEQKIVIEDLSAVLKPFAQSSDQFKNLVDQFDLLKLSFDAIQIQHTYAENETNPSVDDPDALVITDHSQSTIQASDEQLNDVLNSIEKLRSFIVQI